MITDAHRLAAEGTTAGVVHAMLVPPARADVATAIEHEDWPRAVASAAEAIRWIACCEVLLASESRAEDGAEIDLLIAVGPPSAIDHLDDHRVTADATREDAVQAAAQVERADAELVAMLPVRLPVRRTPTGYQPSAAVVADLEQLRHRLGLPPFDWQAWIG